jgi:hypothetical protein
MKVVKTKKEAQNFHFLNKKSFSKTSNKKKSKDKFQDQESIKIKVCKKF